MGGETEREILALLEEAIEREQAAYRLYSRGRELSNRSELKKVFSMLADEELGHEKLLRNIYREYKKQLGLKVLRDDETEND